MFTTVFTSPHVCVCVCVYVCVCVCPREADTYTHPRTDVCMQLHTDHCESSQASLVVDPPAPQTSLCVQRYRVHTACSGLKQLEVSVVTKSDL